MLKKILSIFVVTVIKLSAFHTVEINMNNEELESNLNLDLAQFTNKLPVNKYFIGLNYLYIESDNVTSKQTESMASLNLLMKNRLSNFKPITFGLGVKLLSIQVGGSESKTISAIPLGIYINFALPIYSLPISLSTHIYYSPKPLTFSDGDTYFEHRYELSFEVIDKGQVFIGYRDISTTLQNSTENISITKIPYIGIRVGF